MRYLCNIFVLIIITSSISYGADSDYITIRAENAYSLEIPKKWTVLDNDQLAAIARSTSNREKMIIGANYFDKNGVSRATALLSIRNTKSLSQQDIKSLTKSDLKKYEDTSRKQMESGNLPDGMKAKFIGLSVQYINGKGSLVTETDLVAKDGKRIRQISDTFFFGDKSVKMTVSYDPAYEKNYRPVVSKIRHSLQIN
jgi:hypothetical protein